MIFNLTINLTQHISDHSSRQHRHVVGQMLDLAKQQIGRGDDMEGDLVDSNRVVVGSWKLEE